MKALYAVTVTLYVYAENKAEAYDIVEGEVDYHIHSKTSESVLEDYNINSVNVIVQEE